MIIEKLRNSLAILYFFWFGKTFGRGYERYKINLIKKKIKKKIDNNLGEYFDERIVEIPWIVEELKKSKGNLLDVGSTINCEYIIDELSNLKNIFISTLYPEKIYFNNKSINYLYEDICDNSLKNKFFDNISCISTLEHIGFDNSQYNYTKTSKKFSKINELMYLKALKEIKKLLKSSGKFFITIPFGKKKIYKNLQQFGHSELKKIFLIFKEYERKVIYYKFDKRKWKSCDENDCRNIEPLVKNNDKKFVLSANSVALIKFYKK